MQRLTRRIGIAFTAAALAGSAGWLAWGQGSGAQASGSGTISGTVTDASGADLSGIWVEPYVRSGDSWSSVDADIVSTAANGTYTLNVDAGDYRICFYSQDESRALGCWGGDSTVSSAATISVGSGAAITGRNQSMPAAAHLSGTVVDDAGQPVKGLLVSAYQNESGTWRVANTDFTSAAGRYDIGALRPGTYRVAFADGGSDSSYPTSYWNGAGNAASGSLSTATDITLTAGQRVGSVDSAESKKGIIAGTVTDFQHDPVSDVEVDVYQQSGGSWSVYAKADVNSGGGYSVSGLDTGSYRVGFANDSSSGPYTPEFYAGADSSGASSVDAATDVQVTDGTTATVDAELDYTQWLAPTPTIAGAARVGSVLRIANIDAWRPESQSKSYQWYASGKALGGKTDATLAVTPALAGKTLSVTVRATAYAAGLPAVAVESEPTASIGLGRFTRATSPTMSGTLRVGHRLTARSVSCSPSAGTTTSYQWYANGRRIKGATGRTVLLTRSLRGKHLSVHVSYRARGYRSVTKSSSRTSHTVR